MLFVQSSEVRADSLQTSALDTNTEQTLLQNINSILKEKSRTSVFVAHRLRTIYDSDQIIVLQDGRVAESGSHGQLIDRNGVYSQLWNGEWLPFKVNENITDSLYSSGDAARKQVK